jgi:hypothetical protein
MSIVVFGDLIGLAYLLLPHYFSLRRSHMAPLAERVSNIPVE